VGGPDRPGDHRHSRAEGRQKCHTGPRSLRAEALQLRLCARASRYTLAIRMRLLPLLRFPTLNTFRPVMAATSTLRCLEHVNQADTINSMGRELPRAGSYSVR
jgi:hypothetical protein